MTASSDPSENFERIASATAHLGLDLLPSADLGDAEGLDLHETVRHRVDRLRYAVVGGLRLSQPVLDTVIDAPTWTYFYHYRTVNFALDQAALSIAGEIQRAGYMAFPVPASQRLLAVQQGRGDPLTPVGQLLPSPAFSHINVFGAAAGRIFATWTRS